MKVGVDLNQRPELRTILTPQLLESIELLQYTNIELAECLQQELEKNPALESVDTIQDEENEQQPADQETKDLTEKTEKTDDSETAETFDTNWEDYFDDGRDLGYFNSGSYDPDKDSFETYTPEKISLFQHLHEQIMLMLNNHEDYKIALYLISAINDRGFLAESPESIAQYFNTSTEKINAIRKLVMNLEPIGICSLDLREYLLLQLTNRKKTLYWTKIIISEYFEQAENKRIDEISRKLKINNATVEKCIDEISELAPYPAHTFSTGPEGHQEYIIPDVIFRKIENDWLVVINDDFIPILRINPYYKNLFYSDNLSKSDKTYLKDNISSAENLIKAINQRNTTLFRVSSRILERQIDFFEKGIAYLKPMVLRDIANDLNLHESTISRCTRGKYGQTPAGLFELKFFFTNGLPTDTGVEISSATIKEKIRQMILKENILDPLSDIDIWKNITDSGVKLERKTVSNYREELGILPKHLRRRINKKR